MKTYRIRPANTACLHCWFVAAMYAYATARPKGGTVEMRVDDKGQTLLDFSAVTEAVAGVAVTALQCIQHTHGTKAAVDTAIAATEQMMRAAGANVDIQHVDVVCGEHQTVQ